MIGYLRRPLQWWGVTRQHSPEGAKIEILSYHYMPLRLKVENLCKGSLHMDICSSIVGTDV